MPFTRYQMGPKKNAGQFQCVCIRVGVSSNLRKTFCQYSGKCPKRPESEGVTVATCPPGCGGCGTTAAPQLPQKFAPAAISLPQLGQYMSDPSKSASELRRDFNKRAQACQAVAEKRALR